MQVVRHLPTDGEAILLAVLAARVVGDAHALDKASPLGRAVARFLAVREALSHAGELPPGWADPVKSSEGWRQAWAYAGVSCDTVSSLVLVLNHPLTGDAAAVRLSGAVTGEPTWLSLRSLNGTCALATPLDIFVCENPSIVETAAERLGRESAPHLHLRTAERRGAAPAGCHRAARPLAHPSRRRQRRLGNRPWPESPLSGCRPLADA